jgi:hypothetical protein
MFIVQNIQNCHSAKYYKYFVYNIMDHLYSSKERKGSVFKYLLNAALNCTFSFLRFVTLCGEMSKIPISA